MNEVIFLDPFFEPESGFTYSVITARYSGKWIFVRHHLHSTFEIPGGHIESGETPLEAAKRELCEETGAVNFSIECVCTYKVTSERSTGYGRLYFAEIFEIGELSDTSEIHDIIFLSDIPEVVTYQDIQPYLFKQVRQYLIDSGRF